MAIIRIGSTAATLAAVPDPKELKVALQDIDRSGAGRTANGTMIRDRVAGGATAKRKIELKWPACDSATASQILTASANRASAFRHIPCPWLHGLCCLKSFTLPILHIQPTARR